MPPCNLDLRLQPYWCACIQLTCAAAQHWLQPLVLILLILFVPAGDR